MVKHQRIIEAAQTCLVNKGYALTSVADIAETAQVQKPVIFYYFNSKDALVQHVLCAIHALCRQRMETWQGAHPRANVHLFSDALMECLTHPKHHRLILQLSLESPVVYQRFQAIIQTHYHFLWGLYRKICGQSEPQFKAFLGQLLLPNDWQSPSSTNGLSHDLNLLPTNDIEHT